MSAFKQPALSPSTPSSTQPAPKVESVRTDAEGWQIMCWNLAKAKRRFALHGYKKPHKTFIEELAFTYEYRVQRLGNKVMFHPDAAPNQNRL